MRPRSSTQTSCSYTVQSRSMQISNGQCQSARLPAAWRRSFGQIRAITHGCSSTGRTLCPGLYLVVLEATATVMLQAIMVWPCLCLKMELERRPLTTTWLAGVSVSVKSQKAGHHCRRPTLARASSAGAARDVACSAQHEVSETFRQIASIPLGDVSEGLETPVQLIYLVTLLGFVVVGAYLVVRQVSSHSHTQIAKALRCANDAGERMPCGSIAGNIMHEL